MVEAANHGTIIVTNNSGGENYGRYKATDNGTITVNNSGTATNEAGGMVKPPTTEQSPSTTTLTTQITAPAKPTMARSSSTSPTPAAARAEITTRLRLSPAALSPSTAAWRIGATPPSRPPGVVQRSIFLAAITLPTSLTRARLSLSIAAVCPSTTFASTTTTPSMWTPTARSRSITAMSPTTASSECIRSWGLLTAQAFSSQPCR